MGEYAKAESFFARIAGPNDGRPHTGHEYLRTTRQASLAWIRGNIEGSISLMKQACALAEQGHLPAENVAWTHFMLGEQLFQSGNVSGAETEMNSALSAFPLYHRALAGMGQVSAAQHRFTEAVDFYKRAIAVIPLPTYAAALGDIYHREKKDAEAEKQYALVEYIGQLGALNKQVYNRELALFFADHDRRLSESLGLAQKELEVRRDVYTWDALAWALLKNNRAQEAREAMQKALAIGTQDPLLFFHAAAIERKLANSRATDFSRKALSANSEFHVIYADEVRKWLETPKTSTPERRGKSN
jgi:tetratricopeptide (TPR) repeat protein